MISAATLASKLGQSANWAPHRLRMLVACGAASGLAAAYKEQWIGFDPHYATFDGIGVLKAVL